MYIVLWYTNKPKTDPIFWVSASHVSPCVLLWDLSTDATALRLIMRIQPSPTRRVSYNKRAHAREEERALSRVSGARHLTLSVPISAERSRDAALTRGLTVATAHAWWASPGVGDMRSNITCHVRMRYGYEWTHSSVSIMLCRLCFLLGLNCWTLKSYLPLVSYTWIFLFCNK